MSSLPGGFSLRTLRWRLPGPVHQPLGHGLGVEPKPCLRPVTQPGRAKLRGLLVHRRACDAKASGDLGGVDQLAANTLAAKQLDHPPGERFHASRIESNRLPHGPGGARRRSAGRS
jgi:hypothetical protein